MYPNPGSDEPNEDPGAVGPEGQQDPYALGDDPGAVYDGEHPDYGSSAPPVYDPNAQAYYDPSGQAYDPNAPAYYDPTPLPPGASSPEAYTYGEVEETPAPAPATRPAAAKKKAGRPAAGRKPATKRAAKRPAPRSKPKPVVYDGGLSFGTVLMALIALGLLALVVMVALPKDLKTVAGYPGDASDNAAPRHILSELQAAMVNRGAEITLTEEEVNRYLRRRLNGEQKGFLGSLVSFRGVCVDFSPNQAEVVVEREIFGLPLTMGVELAADASRRPVVFRPVAWNLGRIRLGQTAPKPVVDLFVRLRGSLLDEYQVLQQMPTVRFEENLVVIDSRI